MSRLLVKCLTSPDDPVDEGCFRPLTVIAPRGSVMAAQEPAPTARYYTVTNLLWELSLRALSPAIPDRLPAGAFADQMPIFLFGTNPETDRLFIQGDGNAGGTGARPRRDGESGLSNFTGNTMRNNPVEVTESRNKFIRIVKYGLRQDSGGRGKWRGGLGIERVYEFDIPAFGTFTLERKVTPPWGLRGGENGAHNEIRITDAQGRTREIRKETRHPIAPGDVMVARTGGGGGIGAPRNAIRPTSSTTGSRDIFPSRRHGAGMADRTILLAAASALLLTFVLLCLARAMRTQAKLARIRIAQETTRGFRSAFLLLAQDRELADIYARGKQDVGLLDESEQARAMLLLQSMFGDFFQAFQAWRAGALADSHWKSLEYALLSLLKTSLFDKSGRHDSRRCRPSFASMSIRSHLVGRHVHDGELVGL